MIFTDCNRTPRVLWSATSRATGPGKATALQHTEPPVIYPVYFAFNYNKLIKISEMLSF